jgi:tRNA(Ile)-lysidine synthase
LDDNATQNALKTPQNDRESPLRLDPRGLGPVDESALIGVSGGRDSMALLHALVSAGYRRLIVCHLDHGLRPDSAADAEFVTETAGRYGLSSVIEHIEIARGAGKRRKSIETAARDRRYDFFARVAEAKSCSSIYLGHHADDRVETFLFNLFRGSGAAGLRAMRPRSSRAGPTGDLALLRPLLGVWRSEIDAYMRTHALAYREDESNADPRHTRNRLRGQIIPALEEAFDRNVRTAVWRAAEILSAEDEYLAEMVPVDGMEEELKVEMLTGLPVALQRRLVHLWLTNCGVADVGFDDVEAVRGLVAKVRPAKVNLSTGWHARRRAGRIFIERPGIGPAAPCRRSAGT